MAQPFWIPAALRSAVWLGGASCLAYLKKPDGASMLAVRLDAIGWLGFGVLAAGLAAHAWSNLTLARGERHAQAESQALVTNGPFHYVRNPIYLSETALLLGVGLLYSPWRAVDLVAPLVLLGFFHMRVIRVEEPALKRHFGSRYEEYCKQVPRWLPIPT